MRPLLPLLLGAIVACGAPNAPSTPSPAPSGVPTARGAPTASATSPIDAGGPAPSAPADSGTTGDGPEATSRDAATPQKSPETPPPPPVPRKGHAWPYHAWDRAIAVEYNHVAYGPNETLLAYDDRGWSRRVLRKRAITAEQAKEALALAKAGEGDLLVSKCPFPRHAVVFLDGDVPIASANVCFSCGDVLLWPAWAGRKLSDRPTAKELEAWERAQQKAELRHTKLYPQWKVFFRDGLGLPLEWEPRSSVR